jgi:hypothetical protein
MPCHSWEKLLHGLLLPKIMPPAGYPAYIITGIEIQESSELGFLQDHMNLSSPGVSRLLESSGNLGGRE